MKVLIAHNSYKIKGGEDSVVRNEIDLLRKNSVEVIEFIVENDEIDDYNIVQKVGLIQSTTYSQSSFQRVMALLSEHKPDVCHVHNTLPLISPSIFYACSEQNVPVVQTLHNYRITCANGMFLRKGKTCELCLEKDNLWHGVFNRCYRNSYVQSYALTRMLVKHKQQNTWNSKVNRFICLTEFAKAKFNESSIHEDRLVVKPNFVSVDSDKFQSSKRKNQVLFIGRLEESKGIYSFLEAAKKLPKFEFVAAGKNVANIDFSNEAVEYKGVLSHEESFQLIAESGMLVFPSVWYEGMPMTIIESFALGTPVLASDLGAMKTMITSEKNGLLFSPGNSEELVKQIKKLNSDDQLSTSITQNARREYEEKYSPNSNIKMLLNIYKEISHEGA